MERLQEPLARLGAFGGWEKSRLPGILVGSRDVILASCPCGKMPKWNPNGSLLAVSHVFGSS